MCTVVSQNDGCEAKREGPQNLSTGAIREYGNE